MNVKTTIAFVAVTAAISAEELPRKTSAPRESCPNVDVIYDSVATPDGKRLRTIITKPHNAKEKLPVIFVAGWLSCDSVEAPAGTKDESGLVFRGLAKLPEFALFRMDKQGVGDSEGVCAATDFDAELAGYRTAFRALKNYDFIDTKKIYVLGISNGGGFAPLVPETDAEQAQVRGYISVGGWVKTWFEHMLEIERRRFALMGKSPAEVNDRMKGAATLYHQIGIDPDDRRTPVEAAALERMRAGAFQSTNLLDDALLIATVETGVPVLAFDRDRVQGELGLRLALPGEQAGHSLRGGEIVAADETRPLAVLFGLCDPDCGVTRATERMLLAAVQVKGVPDVSVEEALWTAIEIMREEN